MSSSIIYPIVQALIIAVLSVIGTLICIGKNWFGREAVFTMPFIGLSVSIFGGLSAYFNYGNHEFF